MIILVLLVFIVIVQGVSLTITRWVYNDAKRKDAEAAKEAAEETDRLLAIEELLELARPSVANKPNYNFHEENRYELP